MAERSDAALGAVSRVLPGRLPIIRIRVVWHGIRPRDDQSNVEIDAIRYTICHLVGYSIIMAVTLGLDRVTPAMWMAMDQLTNPLPSLFYSLYTSVLFIAFITLAEGFTVCHDVAKPKWIRTAAYAVAGVVVCLGITAFGISERIYGDSSRYHNYSMINFWGYERNLRKALQVIHGAKTVIVFIQSVGTTTYAAWVMQKLKGRGVSQAAIKVCRTVSRSHSGGYYQTSGNRANSCCRSARSR